MLLFYHKIAPGEAAPTAKHGTGSNARHVAKQVIHNIFVKRVIFFHVLEFVIPKTSHLMVVYHPYRLHNRIDDRGTHEVHATAFEVIADGVGQLCACGQIGHAFPFVFYRLALYKPPYIGIKRTEFFFVFP